jgi:predicted dehydrogenase
MKRILASGEAGTPSMVEAVFGNERGLELKQGDWRADPAASPGGPLTQLGIHQIDNLQYLLGPATRVVAMGRAPRPGIRNELAVGVLLTDAHTRLTRTVIAADSADPDARVLREDEVPLPSRDHLREEIEEFARAVQGGAAVEVGLAEAVSNVAVLQAAALSLATARPVEVDEILAEIGD